MANSVKLRLVIGVFSLAVIFLVPAIRTNFYAENKVKYWGTPLMTKDFIGMKPPFTIFGAGISSQIYLTYDSVMSRLVARAGQNNMYSWMRKRELLDTLAMLKHEQYHFNVTEAHARILNEYIRKHPEESEETHRLRHRFVSEDLNDMQSRYDNETQHGLSQDRQYLWEYRIDSLLFLHSPDSGWVTDKYTGATIFFPSVPKFTARIDEQGIAVRHYVSLWRDMAFALAVFQATYRVNELTGNLKKYYSDRNYKVETLTVDSTIYTVQAYAIAKDSTVRLHERWIYDQGKMYKLSVAYEGHSRTPAANVQIANGFLASFSKKNMDNYWLGKLEKSSSDIFEIKNAPAKPGQKGCIKTGRSITRGFYYGPVYRNDGALVLALDIFEHPDSVVRESIWITKQKIYSSYPDNNEYIYFIPKDNLSQDPYTIDIGYTIKSDSSKKCYRFFNQTVTVIP